ncbi:RNA-dependent RNA polymerase-type [Trema orientale]|uniref:RNA-dependent RNA polymerase-type n=1 Tax=Trema orientale TaxID=63057 RepID=A0A2P5FSQ8_TREOI|nr:RNA-dependent RNA polymerase-type [Trema orientale]
MDDLDLPRSVEELLLRISRAQNLAPADAMARRNLAAAGEEEALQVLQDMSRSNIRNFSAYINFKLRKRSSPSPSPSPSPSCSRSRSPPPPPPPKKRLYDPHSPIKGFSLSPNTKTVQVFFNLRGGPIPCSLNAEASSSTGGPRERERGHEELEALGELEFRKQFLILNYIGSNELHKVTRADEIRKLKDLPIGQFEKEVWILFGLKYANKEDRRVYHDWDLDRTYLYDCYVSSDGSYRFKGPFLSNTKTHLQKVLGDDNVLRVKFAEEVNGNSGTGSRDHNYAGYRKIAREGILVGLRRYCFFGELLSNSVL